MPVDSKIQDLAAATVPALTDVFPGVSDPSGTPSDRKYTGTQLQALFSAAAPVVTIRATTPEASLTASPGGLAFDTAARTLYLKETGSGNTGWIELLTLSV